MKKNLFIVLATISTLTLSACGKSKDSDTTTITTITSESESSSTENDEKDNGEIKIYTINDNINYTKTNDFNEIVNEIQNLLIEGNDNKFVKIGNNETIRVDFQEITPLNNTVSIQKTIIYKNNTKTEDVDFLTVSENNTIDINNTFNDEEIGVIYHLSFEIDNDQVHYLFGVNNLNQNSNEQNKENDKEQNTSENYLSNDELKIYNTYKKDLDKKILKDKEPIFVAKLYAQAILTGEYSVAYSLYSDSDDKPSEEEFIKTINNFSENIKNEFIENIKAVKNGKFIEDGDNGYIEYEVIENHLLAIDMVKKDDVWLLKYLPIQ